MREDVWNQALEVGRPWEANTMEAAPLGPMTNKRERTKPAAGSLGSQGMPLPAGDWEHLGRRRQHCGVGGIRGVGSEILPSAMFFSVSATGVRFRKYTTFPPGSFSGISVEATMASPRKSRQRILSSLRKFSIVSLFASAENDFENLSPFTCLNAVCVRVSRYLSRGSTFVPPPPSDFSPSLPDMLQAQADQARSYVAPRLKLSLSLAAGARTVGSLACWETKGSGGTKKAWRKGGVG